MCTPIEGKVNNFVSFNNSVVSFNTHFDGIIDVKEEKKGTPFAIISSIHASVFSSLSNKLI